MLEYTASQRRHELILLFDQALQSLKAEGLIIEVPRRNTKIKRINPALQALIQIDRQIAYIDKQYGTSDQEALPAFIDAELARSTTGVLRTSNERRARGQSRNKSRC